jgi:cysteine desulfurase/selenocysteine lyase
MPALDVEAIRADFPALSQSVHGRPLVYLDSAAPKGYAAPPAI